MSKQLDFGFESSREDKKNPHRYEDEWVGMPEFIMNPEIPLKTIKLSFKTKEDINRFSKLIGQEIKMNQENYWFPKLNRCAVSDKKYYTDEP